MYRPGWALVKQSTKLVVHGKLEPKFPRLGAGEEVVEIQIQIQIQIRIQLEADPRTEIHDLFFTACT